MYIKTDFKNIRKSLFSTAFHSSMKLSHISSIIALKTTNIPPNRAAISATLNIGAFLKST